VERRLDALVEQETITLAQRDDFSVRIAARVPRPTTEQITTQGAQDRELYADVMARLRSQ
jgi:hypothetical protein